jgi:hypothetical protein
MGRDAAMLALVELLALRTAVLRSRRDAAMLTLVELLALRTTVLRSRRDAAMLTLVELLALRTALLHEPDAAILQRDEYLTRRTIELGASRRADNHTDKQRNKRKTKKPSARPCLPTHGVVPALVSRSQPVGRTAGS